MNTAVLPNDTDRLLERLIWTESINTEVEVGEIILDPVIEFNISEAELGDFLIQTASSPNNLGFQEVWKDEDDEYWASYL